MNDSIDDVRGRLEVDAAGPAPCKWTQLERDLRALLDDHARLAEERDFYRGERDHHHAIQMKRTDERDRLVAEVASLTRERDVARVERDVAAREGQADYQALLAERDALAAVLRELRAAASEAVDAATVYIGADDGNPRTLAERTAMRAAAESLRDLLIEIRRAEGTP